LDVLRDAIEQTLDDDAVSESPAITNLRHLNLVERADQALTRARNAIAERGMSLSEEFVLADLQAARESFEEISGRRAPEDVLAHIFSRFCIGK
jgi:tRNA modification GTPase